MNGGSASGTAPYHEVLDNLIRSIMAAQADVLERHGPVPLLTDPEHGLVNRHFSWLTVAYREGTNRHLFEGVDGTFSLRTRTLRTLSELPPDLRDHLREGGPIPKSGDSAPLSAKTMEYLENHKVLQINPTRISRLILTSFENRTGSYADEERRRASGQIFLRSPLNVAMDYLTAPTMMGSRAYAVLAIRNYIFEAFQIFPDDIGALSPKNGFTVPHLEVALSHVATSFRERHNSRGLDPVPPEARGRAGGVLRAFLATRGVLWMRFVNGPDCIEYLRDGVLRPTRAPFEYARPDHLDRLPELGELINELWGLPIPLRGADTLFRGGLKFSSRQGLIMGIHGGAGSGKTSLALALATVLAPFGIRTLYVTAEETSEDLNAKAQNLVPDELRRLSFFPRKGDDWIKIQRLEMGSRSGHEHDMLTVVEREFERLSAALDVTVPAEANFPGPPKPCRAIVVLDGIHDLLLSASEAGLSKDDGASLVNRLRDFIMTCRELKALVVLTAGDDWSGSRAFDYLVDVAVGLTHEAVGEYGRKPDRRLTLTKARHQLCAVGTHGLQVGGSKGVRLSPQINYQLDKRAMWRTRLPEMKITKRVLSHAWSEHAYRDLARSDSPAPTILRSSEAGVNLFRGANIFLNGEGSSAKAALALKIALSPTFDPDGGMIDEAERILVVSFLYPREYYDNIRDKLLRLRRLEYEIAGAIPRPFLEVIHLYPGNYRADQLFNRIEWTLDAAELNGNAYTSIVIDGLHNVFLQFPEIEQYSLFWPQLYSALRARPITIISTHTTFVLQGVREGEDYRLDDKRSEPLRHALVQKTDFRFEIDPAIASGAGRSGAGNSNVFAVKAVAAINQPIPQRDLLWSRENLVLFDPAQASLPFRTDR